MTNVDLSNVTKHLANSSRAVLYEFSRSLAAPWRGESSMPATGIGSLDPRRPVIRGMLISMGGWLPIVAVLVILVSPVARADEKVKGDDWKSKYDPNLLAQISDVFQQARIDFIINSDPVKRAIVCRLPYAMFTLDTLSLATRLSKQRLALAVNQLVNVGVLKWVPSGQHLFVAPASREVRIRMMKWSDAWCVGDDTCEITP